MPDLSVKGIARVYRQRSAPFLLKEVFGIGSAGAALRPILESIARRERHFHWEEDCETREFGGDARFDQIWTHIVVRINLLFHPNIPVATRNNLMTTWRNTIQQFWSLKWGCSAPGEAVCRLTFEVQWTDNNPQHTIAVNRCFGGPILCRENAAHWFDITTGNTAAHEFGHLLGNPDEYAPLDPNECPIRNPVNTGTVMDDNTECFPDRLMTRFADYIDSQIVAIAEYTHDPVMCT
jgi:hypothetical protein